MSLKVFRAWFSTIQAVLEDAQMKQLNGKAIKNWLQKLNAAAYKVDDILDECKYNIHRTPCRMSRRTSVPICSTL